MAMVCVSGSRECSGCMACRSEPSPIGECVVCKDSITAQDERYDIYGDLVCYDCLRDWAKQFKVSVW